MLGLAKIAVLAACSSSRTLYTWGRDALKPEVISHPKVGSGFKLDSGQGIKILCVDAATELL